ncbi:hypothetical protein FA95DRAFT_278801 [Auriscalpium vulgare]|uniref:Uncharacterized protein n=1 Tax=Auriscalpium vulgare TaxID=40419 RepID=A0ACB8S5R9_9AGAM|nr:hypothetical protein FA95DRAFT_278801 [Auriscalpium vulgare]
MASKPQPISPESTGAAALAQYPPLLSLENKLLSSALNLPAKPAFAYAVYAAPAPSSLSIDAVELARRKLYLLRTPSIIDSILCSVRQEKDMQHLYVFTISSCDAVEESRASISSLHLEGLSCTHTSSFTTMQLYPCSPSCAIQSTPCPTCVNPSIFPPMLTYPTDPIHHSASFIPREPLRVPHEQLILAVRDRLTDDICNLTPGESRRLCRLRDGFLIFPQSTSSDWGSGWEHHAQNRPLIHTYLHLTLCADRFLIQPLLRSTNYVPLVPCQPLPAGTPVTLLPYGTPAHYLACYTGPTSALTAQFAQSLTGLGCSALFNAQPSQISSPQCSPSETTYFIAWLSVQNKNGEAKGLTIIWPSSLALSYLPSSSSPHARAPLSPLPDLPLPLQPSPPPVPAPAPNTLAAVTQSIVLPENMATRHQLQPAFRRRTHPRIAPGPAALRALRTLCLSTETATCSDVGTVAREVGGYVDAVAKERERERERLKREREGITVNTNAPSLPVGTTALPTANTPGSMAVSPLAGSLFGGSVGSPMVSAPASAISPSVASALPNFGIGDVQAQTSSQQFYPSPPQTKPVSAPASAMDAPLPAQPPPASSSFPPVTVPTDAAPQITHAADVTFTMPPEPEFETFGFDEWSQSSAPWQSSSDFINSMSLDDVPMSRSVGMNLNGNGTFIVDPVAGGTGAGWGSGDMDMDTSGIDDIFTDADFDFWDSKPPPASSGTARPPPMPMSNRMHSGTGLTPTAGPAPLGVPSPIYTDPVQVALTPTVASPWGANPLTEGFVPQGLDLAPELLPPSPTKTASSQSAPATPLATVHIADDAGGRLKSPVAPGLRSFEPISFASVHRISDGKYTAGKFALPSPPDEEDRTQPIPMLAAENGRPTMWAKYRAATDPRIGVVRKLIGVKRKSFNQGHREAKTSSSPSSWARASDDWARDVIQTPPPDDEDDGRSDIDSDEDMDDEEMYNEDEVPSPLGIRPSTPVPSYLPLAASLLHTYFNHALLLPLSTPLRPPDSAISPPNLLSGAAPMSVPTPVSPAALLGAASEKSKSLEAAAHILAKEVVESPVWGDAWRASAKEYWTECRSVTEVWQADARRVAQALEALPGLTAPLDLRTAFQATHCTTGEILAPSLEQLESPMLTVGKTDAIIQVLPTALRFWEKLGLTPRAGKKDVVAFVLFEEQDDERQNEAEKWLQYISHAYTSNNLGSHLAGRSSACSRDGLVPLRFDSFRKTLAAFVTSLPSTLANYVFYIATPSSTISLSSPVLRQVFSAVKRAQKTYSEAQILFQFLPAHLIHSHYFAASDRGGTLAFVCSVYDRILRPVDRVMSRRLFEHGERIRNFFQEPAYALARPSQSRVQFVRQHPAGALDVLERHTLLHIGYRVSSCGKWLLASCMDQRGEAHDLGVWMMQGEAPETFVVQQLWSFAIAFAKKASVEWRLIFAKLGSMGTTEVDAWIHYLNTQAPACRELPMVHVSLLSVEVDASWTFLAPTAASKSPSSASRPSKPAPGAFMVDISSTTYLLTHAPSANLLSPFPQPHNVEPCAPHISDPSESPFAHFSTHQLRPRHSVTLVRAPCAADYTAVTMMHVHHLHAAKSPRSTNTMSDADTLREVSQSFHELAVLARARWLKANPILPFHLGALEVMDSALSGSFIPDL